MNSRSSKLRVVLSRWYARNGRALPWRGERDSYRILVSEIMLQQTNVGRVRAKYPEFLRRFPTLETLAKTSSRNVILAWRGMGYNNRALRLRDLAREIVKTYGRLPDDVQSLRALPGIGKYTAHAIASLAFGKPVPVVDVNVRRILSRLFWRMNRIDEVKDTGRIWNLAGKILPRRGVKDWNQALMDFGATVCTSRPQCRSCPMTRLCLSYQTLSRIRRPVIRKMRENLYDGLPLRIYRGRIIEALRRSNGRVDIDINELGKRIKPTYSKSELPWLTRVVKKLEREGLAGVRRKQTRLVVSLPRS